MVVLVVVVLVVVLVVVVLLDGSFCRTLIPLGTAAPMKQIVVKAIAVIIKK